MYTKLLAVCLVQSRQSINVTSPLRPLCPCHQTSKSQNKLQMKGFYVGCMPFCNEWYLCWRSAKNTSLDETIHSHKNLYMHVDSIIHNQKVETAQMSNNWRMDKQNMICPNTEYYPAIKRNKVLVHVTTWMNLENIMLSERSQSQKTEFCMIPFTWNVQKSQIHRDRK